MILEKLNAQSLATIPDFVEALCFSVRSSLQFSNSTLPVVVSSTWWWWWAGLFINQHGEIHCTALQWPHMKPTLKSSKIVSSSGRENCPSKMYNVPTAERNTGKKFPQNLGLMMAKSWCLNKFQSLCWFKTLSPLTRTMYFQMAGWLAGWLYKFKTFWKNFRSIDCKLPGRADWEGGINWNICN